jgi:NAD(P)-dependent dehydrogenase (short-subunit alcohol dehydrogenase family)
LVTVEVLVTGGRANIGLATTRQLLEELAVRMERPPNRLAGGTA